MNKKEKITWAKKQIAEKWKCEAAVFDMEENLFYSSKDTFFEIITFGSNAVIRADESILDWCSQKFMALPARDIMDGENIYSMETKLRSYGKKLSGEHIGYLHIHPEKTVIKPADYTFRLFEGMEIQELYSYKDHKKFDNAFSPDKEHDVLAIAAYLGDTVAAIAGCDDYLDTMWQIGIDTDPLHRNRGLAAYLVKELATEIEKRERLAYYNTWSANIASTRVALGTGFYPCWMSYPSEDL